jgi:hypothetical protein
MLYEDDLIWSLAISKTHTHTKCIETIGCKTLMTKAEYNNE